MKYKLEIDSRCEKCGLCIDDDFIKDSSDGTPWISKSIIGDKEKNDIQHLVEVCPVSAVKITEIKSRSMDSFRAEATKIIESFQLQIPAKAYFCYENKYERYDLPSSFDQEFNELYNSRDAAKDAGCRLIVSTVLPLRANSIRSILRRYGDDKLAPYATFHNVKGNFYYDACQQASDIISKIQELAVEVNENYIPQDSLNQVHLDPEDYAGLRFNLNMFAEPYIRANVISTYLKKNDASRFRTGVDVGTTEVESWGGRWKKKYYFCGLYEAVNKVWEDITVTTRNQFQTQVIDWFYPFLVQTKEDYNKLLVELIKERLEKIEREIK